MRASAQCQRRGALIQHKKPRAGGLLAQQSHPKQKACYCSSGRPHPPPPPHQQRQRWQQPLENQRWCHCPHPSLCLHVSKESFSLRGLPKAHIGTTRAQHRPRGTQSHSLGCRDLSTPPLRGCSTTCTPQRQHPNASAPTARPP